MTMKHASWSTYPTIGGIVSGTNDEESCCGWLWKKTGTLSGWKHRFFRLHGPLLTYYAKFPSEEYLNPTDRNLNEIQLLPETSITAGYIPTKGETLPKGTIRIAHVEAVKDTNIGFKVYGISGKIIDIRADTPKSCKRWINALLTAAKYGRRVESSTYTDSSSSSYASSKESLTEEIGRMSNFVEKCGWLDKKKGTSWMSLYFVLQGAMLATYDNDLAWTVPKSRAYVLNIATADMDNTFEISLSIGKKLILKTETKTDYQGWYNALTNAVKMRANNGDRRTV